jgi:hypothetical protein
LSGGIQALPVIPREAATDPVKSEVFVSAVWLLAIAAVPVLVGCGGSDAPGINAPARDAAPMMGGGRGRMMGAGMGGRGDMMMGGSMQRHRLEMMYGLPASYRELRNPLPANPRVIAEGRTRFQAHCIACHGETGEGNGPLADGRVPSPYNLRWVMSRPMARASCVLSPSSATKIRMKVVACPPRAGPPALSSSSFTVRVPPGVVADVQEEPGRGEQHQLLGDKLEEDLTYEDS